MANKVTKEKEEAETEREGATDGPLLDLSDDAVKKMIKAAKKRGYVTMDQLNSVLPSEEVSPDQIEDTMAMLSDMGINVVEEDEAAEQEDGDKPAYVCVRNEKGEVLAKLESRHVHGVGVDSHGDIYAGLTVDRGVDKFVRTG